MNHDELWQGLELKEFYNIMIFTLTLRHRWKKKSFKKSPPKSFQLRKLSSVCFMNAWFINFLLPHFPLDSIKKDIFISSHSHFIFFLLVSRFTSIYPSRRRIEEKHQRKKILRIFHSLVSHYVLYDMKKFVWYKGIVKSTFAIKTSTLIQKC